MHRAIALPLAAIMLALALSASVAASESDPDAPPPAPTPTGTSAPLRLDDPPLRPDDAPLRPDDAPLRPDDAPLRPDDAPPSDAVAGADAAAFRVYLPLVVRPEPYPPVNRQWELEFIRLLNEERARHGLRTLVEHPLLTLAARRHAYDVGINQVPKGPEHCSHTGTDGTRPLDRLAWAGYPGRYGGEAISCGKHEVYYAVQGLLNSPPHRAILLNPDLVEVGVGVHPIITDVDWMQGAHSTVMIGGAPNP
jgi:uncharacterized protein YkwD